MEFKILNYKERQNLTNEELKQYFIDLRNYYLNQEFDIDKMKKCEKDNQIIFKFINPLFKVFFNPIIINEEKIKNVNNAIFVSNHTSQIDSFAPMTLFPYKKLHLLAKKEMESMLVGPIFKKVGTIFVKRDDENSRQQANDELTKILVHGGSVLMYPEGTINRTNANINIGFKKGALSIAQKTKRPIVPFSISNNYGFRKSPVYVFGDPIYINENDDLNEKQKELEEIINTLIWDGMEIHQKLENKKVR